MMGKPDMRKVKEFVRNLYLTPDIQAEPEFHVLEIIRLTEAKFQDLAGELTEDIIFSWANESLNGEMSWADIRAIGQTLRITNEGQPPGKPWIEVILDEHRKMQTIGNGAAMTLKMQAVTYLATHYKENDFATPAEAMLAFNAANGLLRENQQLKIPQR